MLELTCKCNILYKLLQEPPFWVLNRKNNTRFLLTISDIRYRCTNWPNIFLKKSFGVEKYKIFIKNRTKLPSYSISSSLQYFLPFLFLPLPNCKLTARLATKQLFALWFNNTLSVNLHFVLILNIVFL